MKIIQKTTNQMLKGKIIYLVVCGAKKIDQIEFIIDGLLKNKAKVYVFMTYPAKQMLSHTAVSELSKKVEFVEDFSWYKEVPPIPEEDLVLVAPCTFNTLRKIALGIADDYPLSIIQAAVARKKKVLVAPAFSNYWQHPVTQLSISTLVDWGVKIIWPVTVGVKVTMVDYEKIIDFVHSELSKIKFDSCRVEPSTANIDLYEVRKKYHKQFLDIARKQHLNKSNSSSHGCYSLKLNDEWALISVSGSKLDEIKPSELSLVYLMSSNGAIYWCGDMVPSSESPLHVDIYNRTKYKAVLHSHNPEITYCNKYLKFNTPSYIAYGVSNSSKIATDCLARNKGFVIMKYHGEVCAGANLKDAYNKYLDFTHGR